MAELSDRLTELEVEREVITATLEELKRAFEGGEITEEDYNSSRAEYEEKLAAIEDEIAKIKREMEEGPKVDYSSMEWSELRELAKSRGIPVGEKGMTRERIEEELRRLDEVEREAAAAAEAAEAAIAEEVEAVEAPAEEVPPEEAAPEAAAPEEAVAEEVPAEAPAEEAVVEEVPEVPPEEAVVEEAPPKAVIEEEIYIPEEIEVRRFIKPAIISRVEAIKAEIPSLNSALSSQTMKKQVAESSLKVLEKNHEDGLVDDATYNSLKEKYEREVQRAASKIEEIKTEIEKRKNVTSKYDDLLAVQAEYEKKLRAVEGEIFNRERELAFIESGKLFLVSSAKNYLNEIIRTYEKIEEEAATSGISYPDESFIAKRREEIEKEKENLAAAKSKAENFDTLLETLEREKDTGKIDESTYSVLKKEYSRERSKALSQIGAINGKLKMMEEEMKSYEKLKDIWVDCKSYIDLTVESLKKIWLEDQIPPKRKEIEKKKTELEKLEKEMSYKLEKLEGRLEKALRELA
jgi:ATP-dependent protease HslVU (ClpYQ) peptidase subunit